MQKKVKLTPELLITLANGHVAFEGENNFKTFQDIMIDLIPECRYLHTVNWVAMGKIWEVELREQLSKDFLNIIDEPDGLKALSTLREIWTNHQVFMLTIP